MKYTKSTWDREAGRRGQDRCEVWLRGCASLFSHKYIDIYL